MCSVHFIVPDLGASNISRSRHRTSVTTYERSISPAGSSQAERSSRSPLRNGAAFPPVDDDDISAIMKGANDLKNTRMQLEGQVSFLVAIMSHRYADLTFLQRRRVAALNSQLEATKDENEKLTSRLKAIKHAANEGLKKSAAK